MLAEMPSSLLSEWMAYYKRDPFGGERMDINAANIAHAVYHYCAFGKRKRMPLDKFMLTFHKVKKPRQSEAEMKQAVDAITRILRKRKAKRGDNRDTGS